MGCEILDINYYTGSGTRDAKNSTFTFKNENFPRNSSQSQKKSCFQVRFWLANKKILYSPFSNLLLLASWIRNMLMENRVDQTYYMFWAPGIFLKKLKSLCSFFCVDDYRKTCILPLKLHTLYFIKKMSKTVFWQGKNYPLTASKLDETKLDRKNTLNNSRNHKIWAIVFGFWKL